MESNTAITEELLAISPLLAGIDKRILFSIPEGYFEELNNAILSAVKEDIVVLDQLPKLNAFDLPLGYFDHLSVDIMNSIKMQSEDNRDGPNDLSSLLGTVQGLNVFGVPQGYFDNLATAILNKTDAILSPLTELRTLSPMLYSVHQENTYTAPVGYFNELTTNILGKLKPGKVVMMSIRPAWIRYAVAAVFTGILALSTVRLIHSGNTGTIKPDAALNIDKELDKVADEDIIKFLENNSENIDMASITNSTDANEMPSQEDYLKDEKALDKYLDNVNLNDLKN